jgi:hypothetical protein
MQRVRLPVAAPQDRTSTGAVIADALDGGAPIEAKGAWPQAPDRQERLPGPDRRSTFDMVFAACAKFDTGGVSPPEYLAARVDTADLRAAS